MKKEKIYLLILILIVIIPLISIYLINGIIGGFFWMVIKFIYPISGLLVLLINIAIITIRKKGKLDYIYLCIISLILIFPFLFTVGIIPHRYPSKVNKNNVLSINSLFKETVIIGQGGNSFKDNRVHVVWPAERWAYDIVKEPYNSGSKSLKNYGIWGLAVYSPVNGKVISVHSNEEDIEPNNNQFISLKGNYLYIEIIKNNSYLVLTHFMKGSIHLREGDFVEVGDYLGKVGNSGTSSEPHLHIHHQKENPLKLIYPVIATGLPLYFMQNTKNGKLLIKGENLEPI